MVLGLGFKANDQILTLPSPFNVKGTVGGV
jgi:hypothetical protein